MARGSFSNHGHRGKGAARRSVDDRGEPPARAGGDVVLRLRFGADRTGASSSMTAKTPHTDGQLVVGKVPAVTLGFWIIKIAATTLGETAGDTVTMSMNLGYLTGTAIFMTVLAVLVACQIAAKRFRPFLYWSTIVASTTAGTTMADFADRSLGVGYAGGATILLACVLAALGIWYWSEGTVSVESVNSPRVEAFYWVTITFSQTLGTALGDWAADTGGLGYTGGALVFGAALVGITVAYFWTNASRVLLFWTAFIVTRPLGATVGDLLDKPVSEGGLALSRPIASAVLASFVILCVLVFPQRAGSHPGQRDGSS